MKKHFSLILCLSALALLLVGCDRNEKQARKVGYNYAYAMANYQVDKAAEYATEETKNTTLIMAKHLHKTTPIKNSNFPLLMRKRNGQWMAHDTIPTHKDTE